MLAAAGITGWFSLDKETRVVDCSRRNGLGTARKTLAASAKALQTFDTFAPNS